MITKLKYGNTNTFLIRGVSGNLLVDTDYAGTLPGLYRAIKAAGIRISDIDYVLATHYHPDHIGLISELMKEGVRLLLLDTQQPHVHFSDVLFAREGRLKYEPISAEAATVIESAESRDFLIRLGIRGEIAVTPSHSVDSVSLLLDSGECFVGDLEPLEYLDAYGEKEELQRDWERILSHGPKAIYYAHRPPKFM